MHSVTYNLSDLEKSPVLFEFCFPFSKIGIMTYLSHSMLLESYGIIFLKGILQAKNLFKNDIRIFFKLLTKVESLLLSMLEHSVLFYLEKPPVISKDVKIWNSLSQLVLSKLSPI